MENLGTSYFFNYSITNHKNIFLWFVLFSIWSPFFSIAQSKDSLFFFFKSGHEDSIKVNKVTEYGNYLINNGNYKGAIQAASYAYDLSKKVKFKFGEASALSCLARAYMNKGDYPLALKYSLKSLIIREQLNDKNNIDVVYHDIGQIYDYQGVSDKALYYYVQCLRIRKQVNDKKGIANVYNDIGIVYDIGGFYDKALYYYNLGLQIRKEIKDTSGLADSYTNLGIVCQEKGKFDEALSNYEISLALYQKANYIKGVIACYSNLFDVYYLKKEYAKAIIPLKKSIALSHKIASKEDIKIAYQQFTKLDSAKGNYKSAFENLKKFIAYRDSLKNEESTKKTLEEQFKYDSEKKANAIKAEQEKKDAVAETERKRQRLVIWLITICLLGLGLTAILIYRSLLQNKKAKNIIETQKQLVEEQKHEVETHQKEILSSIEYAKYLQQAILPSLEEINKYLPNSFLYYLPKDIVAGDFYWMHVSNSNEVYIAAADSTGHGVPGAMVSIVCSNALNRAVKEFGLTDTGEILDKTRDLVLETFEKGRAEVKDGMDISLCRINYTTNSVQWSGANNPLWFIKKDNLEIIEIKANKQPIGKVDNPKQFTSHAIQLQKGDMIYLITDGYADQFGGPNGKKIKSKLLQQMLIDCNTSDLNYQKDFISNAFNSWRGNLDQVDDVTVIGIKI